MGILFVITLRQIGSRWRLFIILILALLPIVITAIAPDDAADSEIDDVIINGMFAAAIIPLLMLTVATAAFGNELEDRTLIYLMINPVSRWRIVLPKLLASLAVTTPFLLVSAVVSTVIAFGGDIRAVGAVSISVITGATLYASVFTWAGLVSRRALAAGLIYVFLWEGLLSSFVDGIKYLSLREYILALVKGIDPDRFSGSGQSTIELPAAATGIVIVFTAFFLLSVRRLRNMDVP